MILLVNVKCNCRIYNYCMIYIVSGIGKMSSAERAPVCGPQMQDANNIFNK